LDCKYNTLFVTKKLKLSKNNLLCIQIKYFEVLFNSRLINDLRPEHSFVSFPIEIGKF